MKTLNFTSLLIAMFFSLVVIPANASSLPYEDYYSSYYGIGTDTIQSTPNMQLNEQLSYAGPFEDYYNKYYADLQAINSNRETDALIEDVTDPTNYFKW